MLHGRAARVPFPRILQRELPMLLLIMVNQSMRIKMVLAAARTRCLCSAMCKTLSVMELSTSAVIMLLKIGVLIIVPCVLIKIFKLNHICLKLCWCLLSLASWCSCECSSSWCSSSCYMCRPSPCCCGTSAAATVSLVRYVCVLHVCQIRAQTRDHPRTGRPPRWRSG